MEGSKRYLSGLQFQEAQSRRWLPLWEAHKETGVEKLSLRMDKLSLWRELGYRVVRVIVYSVLFWLANELVSIT